jgi:hypothetical protein
MISASLIFKDVPGTPPLSWVVLDHLGTRLRYIFSASPFSLMLRVTFFMRQFVADLGFDINSEKF